MTDPRLDAAVTNAKTDSSPGNQGASENTATSAAPLDAEVGKKAVQGAAWLGGGQLLRQGLGFFTMALLARLLTPDDFGLFGMTYLAAEAGQIITNFGFGSAIVQRQASSQRLLSACFWINLIIGAAIAVGIVAAGPLLTLYFKRPEIQSLMLPLALNLIVSAATVVPQALLTQRLNFRSMIFAQTLGSVAAALAAIGSAAVGLGYWSLALQPLVGSMVTGSLMMHATGWLPSRQWARSDLDDLLGFSTQLLASNLVSFFGRNMPNIVLGRLLGAAQLALFGTASHLTGSVIYQVSSVVVRVLFPTLSALKGDPERLSSAWLRATIAIAAIVVPIMLGVAVLATDVVKLVLGPQWIDAAIPLSFLSLSMAFQAVLTTASTVLLSLGRADLLTRIALVSTAVIGLALVLAAPYGLDSAALAFTGVSILLNLGTTWLACSASGMSKRRFVAALTPWVLAALLASAALATLPMLLPDAPSVARLLIALPLGLSVYIAALSLIARQAAWQLATDVWSRLRG